VIAPLMLAISAATPIMKGQFTDTDVRWNTITDSTNSNVLEDKQLWEDYQYNNTKSGVNRPRYSSIALYLTTANPYLNDAK